MSFTSTPKRVEYLDSIRGLAALFVLLSHTVVAFCWPGWIIKILTYPFIYILTAGPTAVVMFFVLSGYVLSRPYVQPEDGGTGRKISIPAFYTRRFTRIWLPWFFVFLLSLFARKFLFYIPATQPPASNWLAIFWQIPMTAREFFMQCVFALHDPSRLLLPQDWSLGVELKGSLLMPLFIFLSRRRHLPGLFALALLLWLALPTGEYYITFILGVLLARYGDRCLPLISRQDRAGGLLFLLLGLVLYQGNDRIGWLGLGTPERMARYGWVVSGIGCVLLLLYVKASPTAQHILGRKPLVLLGQISYSVYLLQFIVVLCVLPRFLHWANHAFAPVFAGPAMLMAATVAVSVLITTGLAMLTYRFVEVPTIDLGHKLSALIRSRFNPDKKIAKPAVV